MTTKTEKPTSKKAAKPGAGKSNPGVVGAGTQPAAGDTPAAGSAQPTALTAQPTPESGAPANAGAAGHASGSVSTGASVRDEDAGAGGSSGGQDAQAPIDTVRAVEPGTDQAQTQPPAPGNPGAADEITQDLRVHAAAVHAPTDVVFAACAPRPEISHVLSAREYPDRWVLVVMSASRAWKVEVPHA